MSALTIQDVKDYLGIDFTDAATDRMLTSLLAVGDAYMRGALGAAYPVEDERVKQVQKIMISDLYDNHEISDKVSGATRRLIDSMLLQVRLELALAAEEAEAAETEVAT